MAGFIKRITVLNGESDGSAVTFKSKKKKKKRRLSKWLKPYERRQRRMVEAMNAFGKESLLRHNKSNRKRRNGFLRDGGLNILRANRKALKKLFKF